MKSYGFLVLSVMLILTTYINNAYTLTFQEAQKRVLENNKTLKALEKSLEAAQFDIKQAGVRPNPEAELGLENLGISEIEISLSQSFELGGKKDARIAIANIEKKKISIEYEATKLALKAETIRRFILLFNSSKRFNLSGTALIFLIRVYVKGS